jgi:hypothetical protein
LQYKPLRNGIAKNSAFSALIFWERRVFFMEHQSELGVSSFGKPLAQCTKCTCNYYTKLTAVDVPEGV